VRSFGGPAAAAANCPDATRKICSYSSNSARVRGQSCLLFLRERAIAKTVTLAAPHHHHWLRLCERGPASGPNTRSVLSKCADPIGRLFASQS
jgi:hypothetical protein